LFVVAVLPAPVAPGAFGVVGVVVLGASAGDGAPVVPMPPTVADGAAVELPVAVVPAGGVLVVDGAPLVVELGGGCTGRPGLVRFTPGVLVPPTVADGVPTPRVGSVLVTPVPVPVEPNVGVDSDVPGFGGVVVSDGEGDVGVGDTCEMAGLRSLGTLGRGDVTIGAAGLGRTRSPSGIPSKSACPLCGRGPASTKSDATISDAR
jgi:hypothetical protein